MCKNSKKIMAAAVVLFVLFADISSAGELIVMTNFRDDLNIGTGPHQTLSMDDGVNLMVDIGGVSLGIVEAGYNSGDWHLGFFDEDGYIIGYARNVWKDEPGYEGWMNGEYSSLLGIGNTPANACLIYDSTGNGWHYDTETTLLGTAQDILEGDLFFWTDELKFDGVLGGINLMGPYTATAATAIIPQITAIMPEPEHIVLVSPADAAVNVSFDTVLSWQGETGGVYNVYLGHDGDSLEPVLTGGQDESLAVYGLDWNTAYYWRVEILIDGQTYTSQVWSFTTAEPVVLVSPQDNAVNVSIDPVLNWDGHSGGVYNVYLGTDAANLVQVASGGQGESLTAYNLDWNTAYYWQVEIVKDGKTYSSPVRSFTTVDYVCQQELLGDINGDCAVNLDDLAIMASNWLAETPKIPVL